MATKNRSRRRFLERSASLVSGLTLAGCAAEEAPDTSPKLGARLDAALLEAVAELVLPTELDGKDVLSKFVAWLDALEPVAELDHPYLWTDEILYGPPDPAPLWGSQLEALELEATKRAGASFPELPRSEQTRILTNQLPADIGDALPAPASAPHVAVGLLAFFYQTPEANDLCYQRAIERHSCRGLETAPDEPDRIDEE